jgi:hypothetical protein
MNSRKMQADGCAQVSPDLAGNFKRGKQRLWPQQVWVLAATGIDSGLAG